MMHAAISTSASATSTQTLTDYGTTEHRSVTQAVHPALPPREEGPERGGVRAGEADHVLRRSGDAEGVRAVREARRHRLERGVRGGGLPERDRRAATRRRPMPEWSGEDARYSMIRWVPSAEDGASLVLDPRSGEIHRRERRRVSERAELQPADVLRAGGPGGQARAVAAAARSASRVSSSATSSPPDRPRARAAAQPQGRGGVHRRADPRSEVRGDERVHADDHGRVALQLRRAARRRHRSRRPDPAHRRLRQVRDSLGLRAGGRREDAGCARSTDAERSGRASRTRTPSLRFSTEGQANTDPARQPRRRRHVRSRQGDRRRASRTWRCVSDMMLKATSTKTGDPWDELEAVYGRMVTAVVHRDGPRRPRRRRPRFAAAAHRAGRRHALQDRPGGAQAVRRCSSCSTNAFTTPAFMIKPEILRRIQAAGVVDRVRTAQARDPRQPAAERAARSDDGAVDARRRRRVHAAAAPEGRARRRSGPRLAKPGTAVIAVSPQRAAVVPRADGSEAERIAGHAAGRAGGREVRALVKGELRALDKQLQTALGAPDLDENTRRHLRRFASTRSRSSSTRRCRVRRRRRARLPAGRGRGGFAMSKLASHKLTNQRQQTCRRHRNRPDVVDRPRGGSGVRRGARAEPHRARGVRGRRAVRPGSADDAAAGPGRPGPWRRPPDGPAAVRPGDHRAGEDR